MESDMPDQKISITNIITLLLAVFWQAHGETDNYNRRALRGGINIKLASETFNDLVAKAALSNYEEEGCLDLGDPCDMGKNPNPCCGSHVCSMGEPLDGRENYLIANDNYAAEEGCTDEADPCDPHATQDQCCGTHICASLADGNFVCQQPVCMNK